MAHNHWRNGQKKLAICFVLAWCSEMLKSQAKPWKDENPIEGFSSLHQFDVFSPHDVPMYALCDEENAILHHSRCAKSRRITIGATGKKSWQYALCWQYAYNGLGVQLQGAYSLAQQIENE